MKRFFATVLFAVSLFGIRAMADTLIMEDNCEKERDNVAVMENGIDNSRYYHVENGLDIGFLPYETSSDILYELDVRFNSEGSGFSFMKKGKWNSCIRIKDGQLALQTGSNSFTKLTKVDADKWYHFTFLGRTNKDANPVTYGHIILEEYSDTGERVNKKVFTDVNLRNNAATHYINVVAGTDVDNIKAYTPSPTSMEVFSDVKSIVSGGEAQIGVKTMWNGLEMRGINYSDIIFELYDRDNKYPLEDKNAAIDNNGRLTTDMLCATQRVNVRVVSKSGNLTAVCPIDIITGDVFTVTGLGVNENRSKITQIAVNKNFAAYKDDVSLVVTFSGNDGVFLGAEYKNISGANLNEGENKVNVSFTVPSGFDVYSGKIKVFVITSMTGSNKENAVKIKREELPAFDGKATVITVKDECDISNVKKEDILYFDVVYADETVYIPEGKTYIMGSVGKIDTLFEIE